MKNAIYDFLEDYVLNTIEEKEESKYYKTIDLLFEQERITKEESNALTMETSGLFFLVIKIISNCPYVEININHKNKQKE